MARALPGPRPLASAVAVTLAAQAGVAPLLAPVFGGIPVATLPANLLAAPAAGPITAWGMAAGLPAGLAGGWVARLVHLPTGLLLSWVAAVARRAAAAPLGRLGVAHVAALALVLGAAGCWPLRSRLAGRRWVMVAAGATVAVVAAVPAVLPRPVDGTELTAGARLWRRGGATVLVVDGARSAGALLGAMHTAAVRHLDVLVVTRPGRAAAGVVGPLLLRFPPRLILAPAGSPLAGPGVAEPGTTVRVGPLTVDVDAVEPRLAVRVASSAARSPPGRPG